MYSCGYLDSFVDTSRMYIYSDQILTNLIPIDGADDILDSISSLVFE